MPTEIGCFHGIEDMLSHELNLTTFLWHSQWEFLPVTIFRGTIIRIYYLKKRSQKCSLIFISMRSVWCHAQTPLLFIFYSCSRLRTNNVHTRRDTSSQHIALFSILFVIHTSHNDCTRQVTIDSVFCRCWVSYLVWHGDSVIQYVGYDCIPWWKKLLCLCYHWQIVEWQTKREAKVIELELCIDNMANLHTVCQVFK